MPPPHASHIQIAQFPGGFAQKSTQSPRIPAAVSAQHRFQTTAGAPHPVTRRQNALALAFIFRQRAAAAAENEPARIAVEIFHRAVDVGQRAMGIGAERVSIWRAAVAGEPVDAGGDLGGALVEIVGERADRARRLVDFAALAVRPAGEVLQSCDDFVDAIGIARQRRGELVDDFQRVCGTISGYRRRNRRAGAACRAPLASRPASRRAAR